MDDTLNAQISTAVTHWARETYQTAEIVMGDISPNGNEPTMPDAA